MKIEVSTKIGDVVYKHYVEEGEDLKALHKAVVLGNPPNYCHECSNTDHFKMDSNKDRDGNIYVNVMCKKCGAKAKLGLYKSGGFFWHKFKKYEAQQKPEENTAPPQKSDDLPF